MSEQEGRPARQNDSARERRFLDHPIWSRWSGFGIVFGTILTLYLGGRWLAGATLADIMGEGILYVVLITIGILKVVYPAFDRIVEKGFKYYFLATGYLFVALGPFSLLFAAVNWGTATLGRGGQFAVLGGATVFWALLLGAITYPPLRNRFFDDFASLGWGAPILIFVNFVMISVVLFGSGGRLVVCGSGAECVLIDARDQDAGPPAADASLDDFLNVFLWQVIDAVPFLEAGEDIPWFDPLGGRTARPFVGILIVLFKVSVIVPGFGAFAAYRGRLKQRQGRVPAELRF